MGNRITRFPDEPTLKEIQKIFPKATQLRADAGDSSIMSVYDHAGIPLGWTLRTTPAADSVIGYQGPTDSLIGFDSTGIAVGFSIRKTFDNEPYVSYVRDDTSFKKYFIGQTFEDLASADKEKSPIEGVSGATMTSQAIAQAIVVASQSASKHHNRLSFVRDIVSRAQSLNAPQWGAVFIIMMGLIIGYTRFRGHWFGRIVLPLLVLTYLGFGAGALLSQAQLWGWAMYGIPQGATVLLLLSLLADWQSSSNREKHLLQSVVRTRCRTTAAENHNSESTIPFPHTYAEDTWTADSTCVVVSLDALCRGRSHFHFRPGDFTRRRRTI